MNIEIEVGEAVSPYDFKYNGFYFMVMDDGLWGVYDDEADPIEWLCSFKEAIDFVNKSEVVS